MTCQHTAQQYICCSFLVFSIDACRSTLVYNKLVQTGFSYPILYVHPRPIWVGNLPPPVEVKSWKIYWIGLHIGGVYSCRIVPSNGSLILPRFLLLVGQNGVVEVPVTHGMMGQLNYWQSGIPIAEASHKQADAVGLSGCRGWCCCGTSLSTM